MSNLSINGPQKLVKKLTESNTEFSVKLKEAVLFSVIQRITVLSYIIWDCADMEHIKPNQNLFLINQPSKISELFKTSQAARTINVTNNTIFMKLH